MEDQNGRERKKRRSAVERAVEILQTIGRSSKPLGVTEVARAVDLPKASVYRILHDLHNVDALVESDKSYSLGPAVLELGKLAEKDFKLIGSVEPVLAQLAERTKETVNLGALYEEKVLILKSVRDPQSQSALTTNLSPLAPLHCSALGKALLSVTPKVRESVLNQDRYPKRTENTITSPQRRQREIAEAEREGGFFYDREEYELGLYCIAVPIAAPSHPIAVSVSGPSSRMRTKGNELKEELQEAAKRLVVLVKYSDGL